MYLNRVELLGTLGRDVEVQMGKSTEYARFSLATTKYTKVKEEWKEETTWHNIVAFGKPTNQLRGLKKGDMLYLIGSIKTSQYEKDGQKRTSVDVVVDECARVYRPVAATKSDVKPQEADNGDDEGVPF